MTIEWAGLKFGNWTILEEVSGKKCLCACECGKVKEVYKGNLTSGGSISCGCTAQRHYKHGFAGTPIYAVWCNMITRCYEPTVESWIYYGGRGITVCDRWLNSFENFYEDMGDVPFQDAQIDRVNNDDCYFKENCRWSTATENARNKSNTIFLTFENKTLTLMAWSEITGISDKTLRKRRRSGWTVEQMLTQRTKQEIFNLKEMQTSLDFRIMIC